jgi:hypothetical protein
MFGSRWCNILQAVVYSKPCTTAAQVVHWLTQNLSTSLVLHVVFLGIIGIFSNACVDITNCWLLALCLICAMEHVVEHVFNIAVSKVTCVL